MKRLTALFFAVLRAGVSYAIFALFGAVCAFCALAFEFDNPHRKPAYSDALCPTIPRLKFPFLKKSLQRDF